MAEHPYQLLPALSAEEYAALRADIAEHGIRVPVDVDEHGAILDGHHRAAIAAELGITYPTRVVSGLTEADKREHALAVNIHRRQLGPISWAQSFRRLCEVRGVQLGQGRRNDRTSDTVSEVARQVGVEPRTARRRLALAEEFAPHPELATELDRGDITVNEARTRIRDNGHAALRAAPVPPPQGQYVTIVADPPWELRSAGVTKADARKVYPTMRPEEIAALPVPNVAGPDAHLWLWAINSLIEEAYAVVRAWGFSPVTLVTWCKPGPGVGHYLRNNTEHVILATRGQPMTPAAKPTSTWYQWPRAAHSVKPEEFYSLVREVSPGPRLELFARAPHDGFTPWGNESPGGGG